MVVGVEIGMRPSSATSLVPAAAPKSANAKSFFILSSRSISASRAGQGDLLRQAGRRSLRALRAAAGPPVRPFAHRVFRDDEVVGASGRLGESRGRRPARGAEL